MLEKTFRWFETIGKFRDGILVGAGALYILGYLVMAYYASKKNLGLLPALDFQYIIAGIIPAFLIIVLCFSIRYLLVFRDWVSDYLSPEATGKRRFLREVIFAAAGFSFAIFIILDEDWFQINYPELSHPVKSFSSIIFLISIFLLPPIQKNSYKNSDSTGKNTVESSFNGLKIKLLLSYLFCWEEIPGNDNERLMEFLNKKFDGKLVKPAKIEKFDDGKTIKVTAEKNSLSLSLNNEKTEVELKINNRIEKLKAEPENGKLNIYQYSLSKFMITFIILILISLYMKYFVVLLVPLFVFFSFHLPGFNEFYRNYALIFIAIVVILFTVSGQFYFIDDIYPDIPQEIGGLKPRCAQLDVITTQLSNETLNAILPLNTAIDDRRVLRSKDVNVFFSNNEFLLVSPFIENNKSEIYEIKRSNLEAIIWCGD